MSAGGAAAGTASLRTALLAFLLLRLSEGPLFLLCLSLLFGTQPVSFVFKASVQTARENRIHHRYRVKTMPGSAQAAAGS